MIVTRKPSFFVKAHHPIGMANFGYNKPITVKAGHSVHFYVDADVVESLDDVRQSPLKSRKCYFEDERPLKLFRHYTQENCELECLLTVWRKEKHCIPDSLFDPLGGPYCARTDGNDPKLPSGEISKQPCDCLPLCNLVKYRLSLKNRTKTAYSTSVTVSFKANVYWTKIRSIQTTFVDFLANCAGFLGLFLGISVLTIFEVVYHCFIRVSGRVKVQPLSEDIAMKDLESFNKSHHSCKTIYMDLKEEIRSLSHQVIALQKLRVGEK